MNVWTNNLEHWTSNRTGSTNKNKSKHKYAMLRWSRSIAPNTTSYSANLWVQRFHRQAYLIISLLPGFKSHCQATSIRVLRAVVNPDPTKIINLGRRQAVPECNIFASRTIDRHGLGSKSWQQQGSRPMTQNYRIENHNARHRRRAVGPPPRKYQNRTFEIWPNSQITKI